MVDPSIGTGASPASVAGTAGEVDAGRVRFTLSGGQESGSSADVVRISVHRTSGGEEYLRVHCTPRDMIAVPRLLRQLADEGAEAAGLTARTLVLGITELVEQVYALHLDRDGARDSGTRDSQAARREMLARVKAFARSQLADPGLKPEMLALRHHISLRYLQKLFQEHGESPAGWIRDERLRRCCAELTDPRLAHLTIAVVGERSGLYGASHFSRLFRARYGVSPSQFRREAYGLLEAA